MPAISPQKVTVFRELTEAERISNARIWESQYSDIEKLAQAVINADNRFRISFEESANSRFKSRDAGHFLKFNDAAVGGLGGMFEGFPEIHDETRFRLHLLNRLVIPLREISPQAYKAGMQHITNRDSQIHNLVAVLDPDSLR